MQSKIPLYPYSGKKTPAKRGEIEKWRESFRENCACAGGIDILIRENFDGMHLKDGTVEKIVELYGYKRVEHVLANTVQERRGDGRFRPDNRAWAESHYIPEDEMHNYCFAARSHSAILDGFISNYRKLVMDLGMFDQKQCEPDPSEAGLHRQGACSLVQYPERGILVAGESTLAGAERLWVQPDRARTLHSLHLSWRWWNRRAGTGMILLGF